MQTRITLEEIIAYQQLRDAGLTVREAARKIGRSPSGMNRFDTRRKPKSAAPSLEEAIATPIEEAINEALPQGDATPQFTASQALDLHPTLRARIRAIANQVSKLITRIGRRAA